MGIVRNVGLADLADRSGEPGWRITLYLDAREAAGVYRSTTDMWAKERNPPGECRDPERSRLVAASRARTKVRRYCASNRLNRLGTLTYAGGGCHDPVALRRDLSQFFQRLRTAMGGRNFAYLWVPEWHHSGHGLHAHFAVGRFVKRGHIEEAWGRGFINIKLLGDLPVGSGTLEEARQAAKYLSKYVVKDFDDAAGEARVVGLHRYEVAQGFQPRTDRVFGRTLSEAVDRAAERMGCLPRTVSSSDTWEGWTGPYAVSMSWAL